MKSLKDKTLFLEQLEKNPIIQIACEKTNIGRSTFYRWIKTDPDFKQQVDKNQKKGVLLMNDFAESKLLSAMKNDNMTATIFWLKNNNSRYSEKKINLSKTEIQELVDSVISTDPEHALKLLTEKLMEGKIPRFFINTLISIITKSIKVNQSKVDIKKFEILQKFTSL